MVNLTFIFVGKAGLCRVSWIGSEMSSSSVGTTDMTTPKLKLSEGNRKWKWWSCREPHGTVTILCSLE